MLHGHQYELFLFVSVYSVMLFLTNFQFYDVQHGTFTKEYH